MEDRAARLGPEREAVTLADAEREDFEDIVAWECHPELRRQLSRAIMDVKRNPGPSVISWFLHRADEIWRS